MERTNVLKRCPHCNAVTEYTIKKFILDAMIFQSPCKCNLKLQKPLDKMDLFELHSLRSQCFKIALDAQDKIDEIHAEIHGNINREFKDDK